MVTQYKTWKRGRRDLKSHNFTTYIKTFSLDFTEEGYFITNDILFYCSSNIISCDVPLALFTQILISDGHFVNLFAVRFNKSASICCESLCCVWCQNGDRKLASAVLHFRCGNADYQSPNITEYALIYVLQRAI